eukprot:m.10689 g.10689  ORF g.10689 m.10689 type:complete len:208 (+) comp22562_c0_seq1:47-670(+)
MAAANQVSNEDEWLCTDKKKPARNGFLSNSGLRTSQCKKHVFQTRMTSFFQSKEGSRKMRRTKRTLTKEEKEGTGNACFLTVRHSGQEESRHWPVPPADARDERRQEIEIEKPTELKTNEGRTREGEETVPVASCERDCVSSSSVSPRKKDRPWYFSPDLYKDLSQHSQGDTLPPITDSIIFEALGSPTMENDTVTTEIIADVRLNF